MRFRGSHHTLYEYPAPVYLQPHTIRLRPRSDPWQIVRDWEIVIDPKPGGINEGIDAWGNDVVWAWFEGDHTTLEISTRFMVDTLQENPFDFLVPDERSATLPPEYSDETRAALTAFLAPPPYGPEVHALADEAAQAADGKVANFPSELVTRIHERCRQIVRPEGDPWFGETTLNAGEGSCRDQTMLFMEACRHVGVAARFVSGYVEAPAPDGISELHAWASVYLPGGGWRGFDPTQGLAVSTGHVTLAASAEPAGASPVTGSFRGDATPTAPKSWIDLDVQVRDLKVSGQD
ncbi:MAG: transglutaminase family protein [Actinomycetota bacterium]